MASPAPQPLPPGGTIGILGGGQLGRMLAMAAARLGLNCHIYSPEAESCAFAVAARHTIADYQDRAALDAFARSVDVITYEFENVPIAAVRHLEPRRFVRPGSRALDVAQDRLNEKRLARALGADTAEFAAIDSLADLQAAIARIGLPAILKTTRLGYDGKGQAKITRADQAAAAWAAIGQKPAILEAFVPFVAEVSVVAVRGLDGAFAAYDMPENIHENHILARTIVPALVPEALTAEAIAIAERIAEATDYVGVFAVEFFVVPGADGPRLKVNEMAPRVHNSGHWTMDACVVSQFENHIRAVAGWPLGDTRRHSDAVMHNLIGDDVARWSSLAGQPARALHLYGKGEPRPGRKMGHVTQILPLTAPEPSLGRRSDSLSPAVSEG